MRKQLFTDICATLKTIDNGTVIQHIDLWNNNVVFLEQETAWPMPAVFIEFDPILWERQGDGRQKAKPIIRLHVVTQWEGSAADGSAYQGDALSVFDLLDKIHLALFGLSGANYYDMQRVSSQTNHNHDDIIENIEVFRCIAHDHYVFDQKNNAQIVGG